MTESTAATVNDVLADAVSAGVVPGAVALVTNERELLYEEAFGLRDTSTGTVMTLDTIFRIASMTKTVTAICVLQLVERGLITLDTPVGDVLPAFDTLKVLEGFDGEVPRLRPARRRATLRQLLSHTSGLAYDIWNADLVRFYEVTGMPNLQTGSRASFATPLVSDPGERFNYGTSMDWAGLLVEALDGRPLERYWEDEVFRPLSMTDTVAAPVDAQRARTTPVHARDTDGGWVPTPIDFTRDPEVYAGGHCLYSTAEDFAKIQQLLLRRGAYDGGRLLRPETVDSLFENQIGDLDVGTIVSADPVGSEDVPLGGKKWGLGILLDPEATPEGRAAGSGGWAGGFNTFYWVDRARSISAALYTQTIPFWDDAIIDLYSRFEEAVYRTYPTEEA